ncbi:MAG: leucyl aminopeptidase [Bacteroidales bacterium]
MVTSSTSSVVVSRAPWASLEVEWIFVPIAEREPAAAVEPFDRAAGGQLSQALGAGEFKAKAYEVYVVPVVEAGWTARRIAFVGVGPGTQADAERVRRVATAAALAGRQRGVGRLAFVSRQRFDASAPVLSAAVRARAITDGLVSALFDGGRYKTSDNEAWTPQLVLSLSEDDGAAAEVDAAARRGRVLAESANAARELVNEPGNRLRPEEFAARAAALAAAADLRVEVVEDDRLVDLGMGLLLGVGRGSEQPPRLLVVRYQPAAASRGPVLGLVGKGVTFDTGGISIKPSQGMERMKDDMAGGAAVVAALTAIARLQAPVPVIGVVPIAENMPSGHAIRPGDVIRGASGKTVEVLDTDAEGRLILADALWYVRHLGATHVVDIATLTGSCVVALGHTTSGLFGRPTEWVNTVHDVAAAAGDRVWPMPVFDDYKEQLRSDIADLKNVGGRPGGAITAAVFLGEFAGDEPWAHLDVAGTAWNDEAKPYLPKGPTGVGVRTLTELAFTRL